MYEVGQREIHTQKRVVAFLQKALDYTYLGHWKDHDGNSNVDADLLTGWLKRQGHSDRIVQRVLFELRRAATLGGSKTLYDANREVHGLLRYGVNVRPEVGEQTVTVRLIDWETPTDNDFAVAELAKKPPSCLEYILVHEMVLERHHTERFKELMDSFLPVWRVCRDELNRAPLAHESWDY
jgi:hypothetical protein